MALWSVLCAMAAVGRAGAARVFKDRSYDEIMVEWKRLESTYPEYVQLFTAQDRWGLASPGTCGTTPCVQLIARITDESSLPDAARAEVFLGGALHGDERIGPNAVTELAGWLLEANAAGNAWASVLLRKRSLYVMPMTNAWGYSHNRRSEVNVDTNRDFPYFQPSTQCMKSITARALNELFREHLFQLAITFHGGMDAIVYEWGDTEHTGALETSPDDAGQHTLAFAMRDYAGQLDGAMFPAGPINSIVYPVDGGMEDWAYAGSWGTGKGACSATTFGGYPAERTTYDATNHLRMLNILIEAGPKHPPLAKYGSTTELLRSQGAGNGHISRNVRMALMVLDVVEPYVVWVDPPATLGCVPGRELPLAWEVGGAFTVDATQILSGAWGGGALCGGGDVAAAAAAGRGLGGCESARAGATLSADGSAIVTAAPTATLAVATKTALQQGGDKTRWTEPNWKQRDMGAGAGSEFVARFAACLPLPADGSAVFAVVRARVDQGWGRKLATPVHPDIAPQSHYVNARTNPKWRARVSPPPPPGQAAEVHTVAGRKDWLSAARRLGGSASLASPLAVVASRNIASAAAAVGAATEQAEGSTPPRGSLRAAHAGAGVTAMPSGAASSVSVASVVHAPLFALAIVVALLALCFCSLRKRFGRTVGGGERDGRARQTKAGRTPVVVRG